MDGEEWMSNGCRGAPMLPKNSNVSASRNGTKHLFILLWTYNCHRYSQRVGGATRQRIRQIRSAETPYQRDGSPDIIRYFVTGNGNIIGAKGKPSS